MKECPNCHKLNSDDQMFCGYCGNELSEDIPKYLPGFEPDSIREHLDVFFEDIDKVFPDKKIIWSEWNHERWDRAASVLCKVLGYKKGRTFFETYGYTVVQDGYSNASNSDLIAYSDGANTTYTIGNYRDIKSNNEQRQYGFYESNCRHSSVNDLPKSGSKQRNNELSDENYSQKNIQQLIKAISKNFDINTFKNHKSNSSKKNKYKNHGILVGIIAVFLVVIFSNIIDDVGTAIERKFMKTPEIVNQSSNKNCYKIKYDDFVTKLSSEIAYATGVSNKKIVVNAAKNIPRTEETIEEYAGKVYIRTLGFESSNDYGFEINLMKMSVYTTEDDDYVVKVYIWKANVNDKPQSYQKDLLDRFNCIANGVTQLLTGEMISNSAVYNEYKTIDNALTYESYLEYNGSNVFFAQQSPIIGNLRSLSIYPHNETVDEAEDDISTTEQATDIKTTDIPVSTTSPSPSSTPFISTTPTTNRNAETDIIPDTYEPFCGTWYGITNDGTNRNVKLTIDAVINKSISGIISFGPGQFNWYSTIDSSGNVYDDIGYGNAEGDISFSMRLDENGNQFIRLHAQEIYNGTESQKGLSCDTGEIILTRGNGGDISVNTQLDVPNAITTNTAGDIKITHSPTEVSTVEVGDTNKILFNCSASGPDTLTFTWQKKSSSGEWVSIIWDDSSTNEQYGLQVYDQPYTKSDGSDKYSQVMAKGLTEEAAGDYRCIVSDVDGNSVTSDMATLHL